VFWHSRDDDDSLAVVDEGLVVPEAGGGGIPTDGRNNAAAGAGIDQCLHFDGKLTKTFFVNEFYRCACCMLKIWGTTVNIDINGQSRLKSLLETN